FGARVRRPRAAGASRSLSPELGGGRRARRRGAGGTRGARRGMGGGAGAAPERGRAAAPLRGRGRGAARGHRERGGGARGRLARRLARSGRPAPRGKRGVSATRGAADPALQTGVAIECATERVQVLVATPDRARRAPASEMVGQGHTRRLTAILER